MDNMKELEFLNLEEVDDEEFEKLYSSLLGQDLESKETVEIAPDSKLSARSWALAYAHLESRNQWLKDYQSQLEKRYIEPVKKEMENNEKAQALLKSGMCKFLENSEEDKIKFPDIGTFSFYTPPDSINYPEDESTAAEECYKRATDEQKDFIKLKYSFDKNSIKSSYKETGTLPFEELKSEKNDKTVRFTKNRKKKYFFQKM